MTLLAWTLAFFALAPAASTDTLTVEVTNIKGTEGTVVVLLYDSADTFMQTPVQTLSIAPDSSAATVTFTDVPYGAYAISILHDKNGNEEMDMRANGMPDEGYAFSNGAGAMGPPTYSTAKFAFASNRRTQQLRMIYW